MKQILSTPPHPPLSPFHSLSLQPTHSAELARVVETLRSEKDSLSKQLALAKDMLGKAGDISEQKIRLVEKK